MPEWGPAENRSRHVEKKGVLVSWRCIGKLSPHFASQMIITQSASDTLKIHQMNHSSTQHLHDTRIRIYRHTFAKDLLHEMSIVSTDPGNMIARHHPCRAKFPRLKESDRPDG